MSISIDYAWLSIILSLVSLVLLFAHLPRAAVVYRHHHDDRAAVSLVMAIGTIVIALGLGVSGLGLLLEDAQFSTAGLSLARGALIIVAATLVFADIRQTP